MNRLLLLLLLASSCSPSYTRYISRYQQPGLSESPDYSNNYYWAAHPDKKDPSDSIPQPLKATYQPDNRADVFFLYPTSLTDPDDSSRNASLLDAALNAKTDYNSILFQASAFNEYRIFAPRYRQAHIRTYFGTDTAVALATFDKAYQDIKTAFEYYLQHENKGRPIIIASHSQGSTHAVRLLKEFFDDKPLQQQLVAAWIVGMYIPEKNFTVLKPCSDSTQTGCYCSWRTFRENHIPPFVEKETTICPVTNPINWTTGTEKAPASENAGAVLRKFNRIYHNVASAQVHQGILWTKKPKFPWGFLLKTKNYHIGDINLYYVNIRSNVRTRVNSYFRKH